MEPIEALSRLAMQSSYFEKDGTRYCDFCGVKLIMSKPYVLHEVTCPVEVLYGALENKEDR